jgi:hypothetical protein
MAKDLIIGAASNYTYDHVKYWINSIQRSGFQGDIALVCTNMHRDDLSKIVAKGVKVMAYGQVDAFGNVVNDSKLAPHLERFFYLWHYLANGEEYRYVVTTDVRDVVFQNDPMDFIAKRLDADPHNRTLLAAAEGLIYEHEPWGNGNLELAFGPFFHARLKTNQIYNVGVIGGRYSAVRDMLLMIYQMGINRPYEVVDQAVYNFILDVEQFSKDVEFLDNDAGWVVNLGTTLGAIESGHGDIGRLADDDYMMKYLDIYIGAQPSIEDGVVFAPWLDTKIPYAIVHQYDRVNGLKEKIMEKFDD